MSEEFSFEVKPESIEELKKAINYDELNEINKRFDNGTETEDDIINYCRNYGIEFKNGNQLFVVEKKYFDKVVDLYQKEKEQNKIKDIVIKNYQVIATSPENYMHKGKIREKIEQLDIEIQQCQYADDDIEEYKNDMEKEKSRLLRDKKILQELLEANNENIN